MVNKYSNTYHRKTKMKAVDAKPNDFNKENKKKSWS